MVYNSQLDAYAKNQLIKDLKQLEAFLKEELVKEIIDFDIIKSCREEIKNRKERLGIKNV